MNIPIYILKLKTQIDLYAKSEGISKNTAICPAIEQLLYQERTSSWSSWINNLANDLTLDSFESYRDELKEPPQNIFQNALST